VALRLGFGASLLQIARRPSGVKGRLSLACLRRLKGYWYSEGGCMVACLAPSAREGVLPDVLHGRAAAARTRWGLFFILAPRRPDFGFGVWQALYMRRTGNGENFITVVTGICPAICEAVGREIAAGTAASFRQGGAPRVR
jgi:hypothetical protein